MDFVALLQAAQDRDRVFDGRLADQDWLKAAFERGIFLDVLLVFVQRGRADRAQFAAGQRRLQNVGSVHRAFGRARANQRVQFVDEQNDLPFRLRNFFQHRLQPFFKFAAKFRAGHQRRKIQRYESSWSSRRPARRRKRSAAPSLRRWPSCRRPARQSAPDCSFVRRAENLHHAPNFFIAPDHRIELRAARQLRQIARVFLQRRVRRLRILRRHALISAHSGQRLQNRFVRSAVALSAIVPRGRALARQSPEICARSRRTRP